MNEKSIYKDLNNIIINEHEFDDIDVCMTDIQKSNIKRNLKKNIKAGKFVRSKIIAASAAGLIVIMGVGYTNPTFASQIPILNSIVEMMGQGGDYASYSDIVNKTITYDGKSFTINSVVCYDDNIIIGYTAESSKKIDSTGPLFFPTFKINGKWLNTGFTGGVKNLDGNKVMGTIELVSRDITLPGNFKFDMSFDKLDGTAGNWDFKFNISKAQLSKYTKIYKPNQVVKYGNYDFTIDKISLTPLSTVMSLHSSVESKIPYFSIILDDEGNEISNGSGSIGKNSDMFNFTTFLSKININAKYLTFVPYAENVESKIVSVPLNTKVPFELSQGKIGKISINKISFSNDNDKVSIQGIIYGKLPNFRSMGFSLVGDNPKADRALLNTTIKKVDIDKYEFTREYIGLKNDKNYKLTAPDLDDIIDYDSRITVTLK